MPRADKQTKTIWTVSSGEYSDYAVNLIFEAKEDAERYATGMGLDSLGKPCFRVEEFDCVPDGTPFTMWKRLTVTWLEHPWPWRHADDPNPYESDAICSSLGAEKWMAQPTVQKEIYSVFGTRPASGYLCVTGDDHERVRKVFTEQLAGFKLELPLLHATRKDNPS